MEKVNVELDGKLYSCRGCGTHLALADDLISKDYYCPNGKAFLFRNVILFINVRSNVSFGVPEERMLITGIYIIVGIFCCSCGQNLGWKYESARDKTQKFKEGKFILDRGMIDDGANSQHNIDTAGPVDS
ncbi:protein yippee-like At5g53940 isoform X1 [Dioscorea cayenensis subsp. rotundata]|uniref:Protein yippee-like n=1 Tax=Dioscorea cayennensis subsp. rotundata TaxID=55577 RepID=A0AB40BU60_DIOCR|nr:protein yippee-like At5g53940 isoform X1 [Dioscorea cayenensis subsp. rotundata]